MKKILFIFTGTMLCLLLLGIAYLVFQEYDRTRCPSQTRDVLLSIPRYPNMRDEVFTQSTKGDEGSQQLLFQTSDSPQQVLRFYEDRFTNDGWQLLKGNPDNVVAFLEDQATPIYSFSVETTLVSDGSTSVDIVFGYGPCTRR